MSYMESFSFLDWPLASGQLSTGLDVPLPGSDLLLPPVDGYLAGPATTLVQETKHQPEEIQPLDLGLDDDWNSLDNTVNQNPGDLFYDAFGFEPAELLPSSPEDDSFDLNMVDFGQPSWEPSGYSAAPSEALEGSVVYPGSMSSMGASLEAPPSVLETDPVDIFDNAGRFDPDFDPEWLLSSSSIPILHPVSLEEVESVLSSSPIDVATSREIERGSPVEFKQQFTTIPSPFEAHFQLSASPLNVLLAPVPENPTLAVAQVPQTMTWLGGDAAAYFGGLQVYENNLVMATSTVDLSSSDSNSSSSVSSPVSCTESGSDSVGKLPSPARGPVTAEPYPGAKPERRERKREQNKTAASKYRQRKRAEQGVFLSEQDQLEKHNVELKSRVHELTREINYLKGLISEIYSAEVE